MVKKNVWEATKVNDIPNNVKLITSTWCQKGSNLIMQKAWC